LLELLKQPKQRAVFADLGFDAPPVK